MTNENKNGQPFGPAGEEYWAWNSRQNAKAIEAGRTWQARASAFVRIVSPNPRPGDRGPSPVLYGLQNGAEAALRVWDYLPLMDRATLLETGWDGDELADTLTAFWGRSRASLDTPLSIQIEFSEDLPPRLAVFHTEAQGDERPTVDPDFYLFFALNGVVVILGGMYRGGLNVFDLLPDGVRADLAGMGLDGYTFNAALRKLYAGKRRRALTNREPIRFPLDMQLAHQLQTAAKGLKKQQGHKAKKAS